MVGIVRFIKKHSDLFSVKPVATKVKQLRLRRDDFEPLNLIGKGAFGEVRYDFCVISVKFNSRSLSE